MKRNYFARIIAAFLNLSIILPMLCGSAAAEDNMARYEINSNEALIVFDKKAELYNVDSLTFGSNLMATQTYVNDGTRVWSFAGAGNEPFIYIKLPESFKSSNIDGSEYDVEIQYFDSLSGYAICYYDSVNWGSEVAYELYGTSTDTWKTAKFTLNDAAFNGSINKRGDLKISFKESNSSVPVTPSPMLFRSIKVTRRAGANPVTVESYTDRTGNIFEFYNSEKKVHNEFVNTTSEKQSVNVEYCLINSENGNIAYRQKDSFVIPPKSNLLRDINIVCDICGMYEWKIDFLNDDGSVKKTFDEDQISIVKTDPNGIKSEFAWVNAHLSRYKKDSQNKLLDTILTANVGGIRMGITWGDAEPAQGNYVGEKTSDAALIRQISNLGLRVSGMLCYNNARYNSNWKVSPYIELPDTEEEYNGFKKYCEYIAKTFGDYIDYYEIWNEPNVVTFNPFTHNKPIEGAPILTRITKDARAAINKYDPTAHIASVSVTGVHLDFSKEWLTECLKNGIVDGDNGMNMMALHTYHETKSPEAAKIYELVKWYQKQVEPYGIKDIPIYISEYGVTTPDEYTGIENKTNWIVRDTILFKAHGVGDYMFLYNMEQKSIIDTAREDNFGIVTHPEPAYQVDGKTCLATQPYVAYTAMNYVLGGHVIPDGTWEPGNEIYLNRFKSEKWNSNVLTMWSADGSKSLTLDLGVDKVDYYDRYGNKTVIYGKDGIFTFLIDERPAYIVGNFERNLVKNHEPIIEYDQYRAVSAKDEGKAAFTVSVKEGSGYTVAAKALYGDDHETVTEVKDGKARVLCDVAGGLGTGTYVDVYLRKNDKNISYAQIPVDFVDNVSSELSFDIKDKSNYDDWNVTARVENNMNDTPISGYIEFSEPPELAKAGKTDIGIIGANESKDITINVPDLKEKGLRNFAYSVVTNEVTPVAFSKTYDLNIATRAKGKVVVDGTASSGEWPENTYMKADSINNYVALIGDEPWNGADDKSAKVSVMWDDENLYMHSEVTDDVYFQNQSAQNSWQCDGIQFGLLVDTGEEAFTAIGQANTVFNEFAIALLSDGKTVETYRHKAQFDRTPTGLCETAKGAAVRNGNKTYYEWSMPWEDIVGIKGWKPQVNQKLGFSIMWNDNDGNGRKGWIEYASGIGRVKDAKKFTQLQFVD